MGFCIKKHLFIVNFSLKNSVCHQTEKIPHEYAYHLLLFMPPPSVTEEVYCFPRRQLIFSFDKRVIYHLKGL